jgi:hypothetical protein
LVGFEVLTAVGTKMAVFWVVAPCSLVEIYQNTWRYKPEDSHPGFTWNIFIWFIFNEIKRKVILTA